MINHAAIKAAEITLFKAVIFAFHPACSSLKSGFCSHYPINFAQYFFLVIVIVCRKTGGWRSEISNYVTKQYTHRIFARCYVVDTAFKTVFSTIEKSQSVYLAIIIEIIMGIFTI